MSSGACRLTRSNRLRDSRDFRRVARSGRRRASRSFVVLTASGHGCLGVTVSRKVGNAVVRNRVKRRIREWFRHRRAAFDPDADIVVIAKPGAGALATVEIDYQLCELMGLSGAELVRTREQS